MIGHASMIQVLNLWTELEACWYGKSRYSKDTTEIYLHTLDLYILHGPDTGTRHARAESALKTLKELCMLFQNLHFGSTVEIENEDGLFVKAKEFVVVEGSGGRTRYHVKVTRKAK